MRRDLYRAARNRAARSWFWGLGVSGVVTLFLAVSPLAVSPLAAQVTGPLAQFDTYLIATHFLRGESYETHHYFKELRNGVLQGLVFRTADSGAPLIEVEWAISQEVFDRLPDWQKEFWHPLAPAVDAGRVRIPGLSPADEREMLQSTIRGLHAQTLNLAGLRDELPVGLEGVAMVTHITREELLRALAGEGSR